MIFILAQLVDLNVRSQREGLEVFGFVLAVIAVVGFVVAIVWSIWRIWKIGGTLHSVMSDTCKMTAMVFIILLGAAMLTAAFRGFGGEELVRHFLTGLPGGFWTQMFTVMLVIFLLGFFLDFIEIAVVVVPIVAPILLMDPSSNVTAVWLGVMIGLNVQTSFLTPPFGFALFYLRGGCLGGGQNFRYLSRSSPLYRPADFGLGFGWGDSRFGELPAQSGFFDERICPAREKSAPARVRG